MTICQWRWWWKLGHSMLQRRKRNDEDCYFISWKKRSSLQCRWKMATIFPGNENSEATPGTTDPISPIGSPLSRWEIFYNFFLNIFSFFLNLLSYFFLIGVRSQCMGWVIPPLQVAIMFISLLLYGFGPIGVDLYKRSSMVSRQDELDDQMVMLNLLRC